MLENILSYEKDLFFLINHAHTAFWDNAMWLYSGKIIWIPVAVLVLINIVHKKKWTQWLLVLSAIVVTICICDQFSSHIIKPLVARPRPTHYPGIMEHVLTLYGYKGGMYGFISGHATNSFGFAIFTALLFRNRFYCIFIFLWAAIMAYSRIYLGVHFISDIVAGMLSGIVIGCLVYLLYRFIQRKIMRVETPEERIYLYSKKQINRMTLYIVSYICLYFVFSGFLIQYLK